MIREYSIKIDDAILQGREPTEFRQPTRADCAVMNRYGGITIGDHFLENCGPRLILSPPEPEQPPTLPPEWELAEPKRRDPLENEWWWDAGNNCPVQAGNDYQCDAKWIIRRKPAPAPDPRESLALAIREALPRLETLCDLARKALTQSPSASATLSVLEADPRKKFTYISEHGASAYLDLKARSAVERKAASL